MPIFSCQKSQVFGNFVWSLETTLKQWYTSTKQLQETSLQVCATVRRLPREKLVVLDNTPPPLPMVAAGEAHPEHHGPAHGTRVPRILLRSVEWDILSTAVLTFYMRAFALYISSLLFPINLLLDARCSGSKAEAARVLRMTHGKRNLRGVTPTCTNMPTIC